MITDQELWIEALADRSNVAHAYNEDVARGIIKNTKEKYVSMFQAFQESIEKRWL